MTPRVLVCDPSYPLERVREFLPVYYDPTRRNAVFGPGAPLTSQAAIERAIQPAKPVRAIAG